MHGHFFGRGSAELICHSKHRMAVVFLKGNIQSISHKVWLRGKDETFYFHLK